ncbi:MAG: CheR family methyltransferase [Aliidongia sp.]
MIGRQTGLVFDDARLGFLGTVLQRRLGRLDESGDLYLGMLEHNPSPAEIGALAREVTVGETYFFRNGDQFRALAERVLPERMADDRPVRTLSILSAGCASGEEAYTLAIIAREAIADPSWGIRIRAVDLNPAGTRESGTRTLFRLGAARHAAGDAAEMVPPGGDRHDPRRVDPPRRALRDAEPRDRRSGPLESGGPMTSSSAATS